MKHIKDDIGIHQDCHILIFSPQCFHCLIRGAAFFPKSNKMIKFSWCNWFVGRGFIGFSCHFALKNLPCLCLHGATMQIRQRAQFTLHGFLQITDS